jgi:hypothetical protein
MKIEFKSRKIPEEMNFGKREIKNEKHNTRVYIYKYNMKLK